MSDAPGASRRSELRSAILALLAERAPGATICPSEAARAVAGEGFRELMEATREVAGELVGAGEIDVTQRGRVVDPATARGPIRLRRRGRVSGGRGAARDGGR